VWISCELFSSFLGAFSSYVVSKVFLEFVVRQFLGADFL